MVGTFEDASLALTESRAREHAHLLSMDGSTRTVYLINGVVYKVEHYGVVRENRNEFETITRERDNLPEGVFYPEVSLFAVGNTEIIAMSYIQGQAVAECYCTPDEECDDSCMPAHVWEQVNGVLDDTGGFNVILNTEGIWIIDAA